MALKLPPMGAVRKGAVDVDTFKAKWEMLAAAFDQTHLSQVAKFSFQALYQACYQSVQHGHGEAFYGELEKKLHQQVSAEDAVVRAALNSGGPTAVLRALVEQWERTTLTARRIQDLVAPLEREYCAKAKKPGVVALRTRLFGRRIVSDPGVADALRQAFLDAVTRDRDGDEMLEHMLLRAVSLMVLNIDSAEESSAPKLYRSVLEQPYFRRAEAYYENEAATLIGSMPVPQFVRHYNDRLRAEIERTRLCLDASAVGRIDQIVSNSFVGHNAERLITTETSGVAALLRAWRTDDLRAVYAAFHHIRDLKLLIDVSAAFVYDEGLSIVTNETNIANPVEYVEKLIELRGKVTTLVDDVYHVGTLDRTAMKELLSAFGKVVNQQNFTAQYLSRLLDHKLRSQATDAEIEKASDDVMAIFGQLQDKDLFETAYKGHLARRLLAGRLTSSEEQERIFIARLKKECGVSVASSLEGMFADRTTSDDLMDRFRDRLAERGETINVAMHCFVLTAGFWPPTMQLALALPSEMERTAKIFKMFYLGRHAGRRFDYSYANGSVDVRLNHSGRRYDINVPTQCAPVLVHFQGNECVTVEEIAQVTELSVADAAKAVASLVRSTSTFTGPLAMESGAGAITASSKVKFNTNFKSKNLKLRIAIAVAAKEKEGLNSTKAREQLEEDRKYRIDAAIVRIMKSRKTLDHATLIVEVISVLSKVFAPAPDLIKKRIEHLIEREFLERGDTRNVYNYLA